MIHNQGIKECLVGAIAGSRVQRVHGNANLQIEVFHSKSRDVHFGDWLGSLYILWTREKA